MLTTPRLHFRSFQPDDWRAIYKWSHDAEANLYDEGEPLSEAEAKDIVESIIESTVSKSRTDYYFMLHRRSDDGLIGSVYIAMRDEIARKAEIGYRIDRQYWGQGYATEAAQRIVEYGFDRLEVHRIFADVVCENVGSVHVLEKIGMQREGLLREDVYFHQHYWDVCTYAILASDWMRES